jgi:hypothetical protein
MTAPIDAYDRICLHLEELGASFSVDERVGALMVPLGAAGVARIEFEEVESNTIVLFSTVLLEGLTVFSEAVRPLAAWTAELRGAKLFWT